MGQKTFLITINHAPHGSIFYVEGLRTAVGMISTMDEHNATVLFLGDGAWAALAGMDRSETNRHIATLAEWGNKQVVEQESLERLGIRADEVSHDVEIVPRIQILALLNTADFVVDF